VLHNYDVICSTTQAAAVDAVRLLLQTANSNHPDAYKIQRVCTQHTLQSHPDLRTVFEAVVQVMHAARGQETDQAVQNASCVFLRTVLAAHSQAPLHVAHQEQAGQLGLCEAVLAAMERVRFKYSKTHAADALQELLTLPDNVHRVQKADGVSIIKRSGIDKAWTLLRQLGSA
jgi:hypothetical protein